MLSNRCVLIADDDLEVRRGVVDLLAPLGLELVQAESGIEVLEILAARGVVDPLHLLVLDVQMPGCTGLEVLATMKSRFRTRPVAHPLVPAILCSGCTEPDVQKKALEAGAFSFLAKPVQPELLRGEVLRALRSTP
jgi:CheY-like chemotaxis protein